MSVENPIFQPSHADKHHAAELKWRDAPPGMSGEMALLAGGCGRLYDRHRDHALQGLAAVKGRNLSASALIEAPTPR